MEKQQILDRMKELHAEYSALAQQLATLDGPERRAAFEKEQRKRLENFKKELTVEATSEAKEIDWADIESKIFSDSNLDEQLKVNPEGYLLGFDAEGIPCLGVSYQGGGGSVPFAYDKVDAERYVKRQKRKQKYARK